MLADNTPQSPQRKMVCALVLVCRTHTPPQILKEMFGPCKVVVPKAPALGLLLEQPLFESYNRKITELNAKLGSEADGAYRPVIDFERHRGVIERFKEEQIYSRMRAQEDDDATRVSLFLSHTHAPLLPSFFLTCNPPPSSLTPSRMQTVLKLRLCDTDVVFFLVLPHRFDAWIRSIDSYAGSDLLYLNPKGVIPSVAMLRKGEARANAFREKKRFDASGPGPGAGVAGVRVDEEGEGGEEEEEHVDQAKLKDMEG